jgi:hypothetical protein
MLRESQQSSRIRTHVRNNVIGYGDGPLLAEDPDRIGLEAEAYCLPL